MKLSLFWTVTLICLTLFSCTNHGEPAMEKREASVQLDYTIMESGSMSRAGEQVYMDFFESCIKTKKLAPRNFELKFVNKESSGEIIKDIAGKWGDNEGIRLPECMYQVTGSSSPENAMGPRYSGDSLWLTFDETVFINQNTKNLTLSAKYDCFLLLFDANNIDSISAYHYYSNSKFTLNRFNDIYYIFVNKTVVKDYNRDSALLLKIQRPSGTTITIDLTKMNFEFGKYYYFNDVTNSFNIEVMEPGN